MDFASKLKVLFICMDYDNLALKMFLSQRKEIQLKLLQCVKVDSMILIDLEIDKSKSYQIYDFRMNNIAGGVSRRIVLIRWFKSGNTCRSPIAEAVFIKAVQDAGEVDKWEVDSAGLYPWYIGKPANPRALEVLTKYNIPYNNFTRQICERDFLYFDIIFGMDMYNMEHLGQIAPEDKKARLLLFGDFDPQGDRIIRDPFFDEDSSGFEKCFHQATRCSKAVIETFKTKSI